MIVQPWELLELVPRVAAIKRRGLEEGVLVLPGNNLGYFGPDEALLRSPRAGGRDHFAGCQAGRFVLGIEADGTVKGCPSLQTDAYRAADLRTASVADAWRATALEALRARDGTTELWGECARCAYATVCRGGCTFTAHAIFGRAGNDPYCFHRARELAKRGLREHLVPLTSSPGRPFDSRVWGQDPAPERRVFLPVLATTA
jgi:radical SAM protein with 4Fe4S-binding SPASM domain